MPGEYLISGSSAQLLPTAAGVLPELPSGEGHPLEGGKGIPGQALEGPGSSSLCFKK